MSSKLRSMQKGHKGAITRLWTKFEGIQAAAEVATLDQLQNIEDSLRQKLGTICEIHEQLLDIIFEEDEIENEIITYDDYKFDIQGKIMKVVNFRKIGFSNLNANSQNFSFTEITPLRNCANLTTATESSTFTNMTDHSRHTAYHRLPKLDLPRFDGNILDWQSFWDSYESAIHSNHSLTAVQKFTYLRSLLTAEAAQTVAGFALTNAKYEKAVSLLHDRFGQRDKIIDTYMKSLLDISAPNYNLSSLRHFHDTTETFIRALDSMGQTQDTYGSLLSPVIMQKLPPEIRRNMVREHGATSWSLSEVMRGLLKEITILDAGSAGVSRTNYFTTSTFLTESEKRGPRSQKTPVTKPFSRQMHEKSSTYCKASHSTSECTVVLSYDKRLEFVKRHHLCMNCLGKHKVAGCRSRFNCKICAQRHHTSICNKNQTHSKQQDIPNNTSVDTTSSVLHSAHPIERGPVILKTAVLEVRSTNISTTANILFDEGAQSSFLTQKLADKLKITPTERETINLSGFEDTQRRVRHLDTATVYLQAEHGAIPIKVLIVPEISVPLNTYQNEVKKCNYLRGLKLAHPLTGDTEFEIELLIGADHFWDVVQDHTIRGDGPTAVKSRIGYLLSGPLHKNRSHVLPVSMMYVMTNHIQEEVDLEKFWRIEESGLDKSSQDEKYEIPRYMYILHRQ